MDLGSFRTPLITFNDFIRENLGASARDVEISLIVKSFNYSLCCSELRSLYAGETTIKIPEKSLLRQNATVWCEASSTENVLVGEKKGSEKLKSIFNEIFTHWFFRMSHKTSISVSKLTFKRKHERDDSMLLKSLLFCTQLKKPTRKSTWNLFSSCATMNNEFIGANLIENLLQQLVEQQWAGKTMHCAIRKLINISFQFAWQQLSGAK